jgi:predicted  nucleic acid-binding Zn-ribbon protein
MAKDKVEREMTRLHEIIEQQTKTILSLEAEIANLHHQVTGYDSVIDFLWHKLQER